MSPTQPWQSNPLLRFSYSLIAPLYDWVIERPLRHARQTSLASLHDAPAGSVLICGAGTGLDLPMLPDHHRYAALDFNGAMLARARPRAAGKPVQFCLGDCMQLPFPDASFDHVVLHLIVAVVPEPQRALAEAARVLKPGGRILLLDKFLRPGQVAPLRRIASPLLGKLATRTDVIFEDVLATVPNLVPESNTAAFAGGWFRRIVLRKT